jgi:hypothetical protein
MIDSPERMSFLKSDDVKKSPAKPPRDISQDGHEHGGHDDADADHDGAFAQHGPVVSAHLASDNDAQEHSVHITHSDGHHRKSSHKSASEALEHMSMAHAAGADKVSDEPKLADDEEGNVPLD